MVGGHRAGTGCAGRFPGQSPAGHTPSTTPWEEPGDQKIHRAPCSSLPGMGTLGSLLVDCPMVRGAQSPPLSGEVEKLVSRLGDGQQSWLCALGLRDHGPWVSSRVVCWGPGPRLRWRPAEGHALPPRDRNRWQVSARPGDRARIEGSAQQPSVTAPSVDGLVDSASGVSSLHRVKPTAPLHKGGHLLLRRVWTVASNTRRARSNQTDISDARCEQGPGRWRQADQEALPLPCACTWLRCPREGSACPSPALEEMRVQVRVLRVLRVRALPAPVGDIKVTAEFMALVPRDGYGNKMSISEVSQ